MFKHKCEVFIQYVKELEQKQQFLFFLQIASMQLFLCICEV